MEAACRGASQAGGRTVGILPGVDRGDANAYVDVAIATGLGEARNAVVGLGTWDVEGVVVADSPAAAVETVLRDLTT